MKISVIKLCFFGYICLTNAASPQITELIRGLEGDKNAMKEEIQARRKANNENAHNILGRFFKYFESVSERLEDLEIHVQGLDETVISEADLTALEDKINDLCQGYQNESEEMLKSKNIGRSLKRSGFTKLSTATRREITESAYDEMLEEMDAQVQTIKKMLINKKRASREHAALSKGEEPVDILPQHQDPANKDDNEDLVSDSEDSIEDSEESFFVDSPPLDPLFSNTELNLDVEPVQGNGPRNVEHKEEGGAKVEANGDESQTNVEIELDEDSTSEAEEDIKVEDPLSKSQDIPRSTSEQPTEIDGVIIEDALVDQDEDTHFSEQDEDAQLSEQDKDTHFSDQDEDTQFSDQDEDTQFPDQDEDNQLSDQDFEPIEPLSLHTTASTTPSIVVKEVNIKDTKDDGTDASDNIHDKKSEMDSFKSTILDQLNSSLGHIGNDGLDDDNDFSHLNDDTRPKENGRKKPDTSATGFITDDSRADSFSSLSSSSFDSGLFMDRNPLFTFSEEKRARTPLTSTNFSLTNPLHSKSSNSKGKDSFTRPEKTQKSSQPGQKDHSSSFEKFFQNPSKTTLPKIPQKPLKTTLPKTLQKSPQNTSQDPQNIPSQDPQNIPFQDPPQNDSQNNPQENPVNKEEQAKKPFFKSKAFYICLSVVAAILLLAAIIFVFFLKN